MADTNKCCEMCWHQVTQALWYWTSSVSSVFTMWNHNKTFISTPDLQLFMVLVQDWSPWCYVASSAGVMQSNAAINVPVHEYGIRITPAWSTWVTTALTARCLQVCLGSMADMNFWSGMCRDLGTPEDWWGATSVFLWDLMQFHNKILMCRNGQQYEISDLRFPASNNGVMAPWIL